MNVKNGVQLLLLLAVHRHTTESALYILSHASDVGSLTNHTGPVLLRQGEPGTPQYLHLSELWAVLLQLDC